MSLSSALYSGISGMNTNGTAMSVIGNNIANTNTVGFKSSRTIFSDLLASSVNGSGGASQVGRGTGLAKVDTLFAQGTFETTKSDTDLAIEGEGLFVVREAGSENLLFTRAGSFRFDGNGYLITPEGYRMQGKPYNNGVLSTGGSTDIRVDINDGIPAKMTGTINLSTNLDANAATVTGTFDPADPSTYNYAHSTDVYDSLGNTHLLTTYFSKTADNNWDWHVVDANNTTVFSSATDGGSLVFDTSGRQAAGGTTTLGPLSLGAGTAPQSINFALQNTTQYANDSQVISHSQDGYGAGNLTNISIDNSGNVLAKYSNGQQVSVARMVLAKFSNFGGLQKEGNNLYSATTESGSPRIGLPGSELGNIFTNALEQSTVDLAAEFVKMITTQRGFQANSKVITTTDEMLAELINLKR
ncbi:flagellar hook protein FlgE [Desulfuromonas sp. CSMB_57]|jgi:flagellar hook protein FlgE|uniref:flagellar hook protein FlgE n=1 Tax=Desulfuromonas sp. CSMB_57 TaxID=2807629 RepID=UPI001CD657C6|nr:flagellar hook protein FlgE [Desulfuromonas sp. CSMB_57]